MDPRIDPRIDAIERRAFASWPAEEVAVVDGWRLRAMHGVSHRANSAWVRDDPAPAAAVLEARIDRVEAWYAARGLPPSFQLTVGSEALDAALAARGYAVEAAVSVQIAQADDVIDAMRAVDGGSGSGADHGDAGMIVSDTLFDGWFDLSARKGRFADVVGVYAGLLARVGAGARYALAYAGAEPAAVGLGVVDSPWMGIFSMRTRPELRRRGAARAVLGGLARAARDAGAPQLYLQVERDNPGAVALYAAASFRELYGYHYRTRPR